jgi:hypothetical protein
MVPLGDGVSACSWDHQNGPWSSGRSSKRIDELDVGEVSFVVGDEDATICFRDGSDDGVETAAWPSLDLAVGHQPRPDQAGPLVER